MIQTSLLIFTLLLRHQCFADSNYKVLITSGLTDGDDQESTMQTEIVSLFDSNNNNDCSKYPDFPKLNFGATGGLVNGDTILICGGKGYPSLALFSEKCYALFGNGTLAESKFKMISKRSVSDSIVLDDGSLMILGGYNNTGFIETTEFVKFDQPSKSGPRLPQPLMNPCFVRLNSTTAIVVGGHGSNKTLFYDIGHQIFKQGPELPGRGGKAFCGLVEADDILHVVAQVEDGDFGTTTTTHIWRQKENAWDVRRPVNEVNIKGGQFVTSPDGGRIFLIGGMDATSREYLNTIFELEFRDYPGGVSWQWIRTGSTLTVNRAWFVAIPIPGVMTDC